MIQSRIWKRISCAKRSVLSMLRTSASVTLIMSSSSNHAVSVLPIAFILNSCVVSIFASMKSPLCNGVYGNMCWAQRQASLNGSSISELGRIILPKVTMSYPQKLNILPRMVKVILQMGQRYEHWDGEGYPGYPSGSNLITYQVTSAVSNFLRPYGL